MLPSVGRGFCIVISISESSINCQVAIILSFSLNASCENTPVVFCGGLACTTVHHVTPFCHVVEPMEDPESSGVATFARGIAGSLFLCRFITHIALTSATSSILGYEVMRSTHEI